MTSGGSEPSGEVTSRRVAISEAVIGAGVLALAAVMLWQTLAIPVSPIYAQVGPTVVPIITALALGMLGVLLLIAAWQGGWQSEEEKASTPDRMALAWVAAGLVLNVLLIGSAGFTVASVILFVCVARGFGSKAIVRDTVIAAVFALVAYFGFAQTLGINIGSGIVENAIERVLGIEGEGG